MTAIGGHRPKGDHQYQRRTSTLDGYLDDRLRRSLWDFQRAYLDQWIGGLTVEQTLGDPARAVRAAVLHHPRRNGRTEALRIAERALRESGLDVVRWAYDPDRPRPAGASWHAPGHAIDLPGPPVRDPDDHADPEG